MALIYRSILGACPVFLGVLVSAPASGSELAKEEVHGTVRVCIYEKEGAIRLERRTLQIGFAQLCPQRYIEPEPAAAPVPFMAQLQGQRTRNGQRVCIYRHGSILYERPASLTVSCPISPY
jgi:hypothetical protein